ncbi:hypothetical protein PGT21_004863 [Puccinia graminis f. sp. tritici]|uniref:Uncharacterized protein n=1 Tax=Puccinia graminis f. sp. tritici TaxID=56615 RepID=A0A5B0S161_PUCGR|nr:hypothetical protein PGT21_004863 [Puccinia graminis f. sp. tritici]KAA1130404.1 hypothetical protein PGTUg99_013101 [Puccinia graminis f. sp. tritici]
MNSRLGRSSFPTDPWSGLATYHTQVLKLSVLLPPTPPPCLQLNNSPPPPPSCRCRRLNNPQAPLLSQSLVRHLESESTLLRLSLPGPLSRLALLSCQFAYHPATSSQKSNGTVLVYCPSLLQDHTNPVSRSAAGRLPAHLSLVVGLNQLFKWYRVPPPLLQLRGQTNPARRVAWSAHSISSPNQVRLLSIA